MDNQQALLAKIKQIEAYVQSYKTAIEPYLADTNQPIDERWLIYQALPSFLRNHVSYVQDFLVCSDGSFLEAYMLRDFNRKEVVNVHSFLVDYQEEISEYNDDNENRISVAATREYILSKNLGSFENDW
jgi:hypothetical protein